MLSGRGEREQRAGLRGVQHHAGDRPLLPGLAPPPPPPLVPGLQVTTGRCYRRPVQFCMNLAYILAYWQRQRGLPGLHPHLPLRHGQQRGLAVSRVDLDNENFVSMSKIFFFTRLKFN